jgi:diguanylate cyclase (GGDEF)-like protein
MNEPLNQQYCSYLAEILGTVKSTNQFEHVLHLIVDRITRIVHCQTCAVVLIDEKTEYLRIDNFYGLSHIFCNQFRRNLATAAIGELLWTGKPILISDSDATPQRAIEVRLEHPFGSCLCLQIAVDHRTLGYLHVDTREKHVLDQHHIALLQPFADMAGIAIFKARMFEENLHLERVDRETGLEKYGPFLEKVGAGMQRARQFQEHFAIGILDIDNFKSIVNTYGYESSRLLLRELGGLIKSHLRNVDAAGRYGFDEAILLFSNTDLERAMELANDVRLTIEQTPFTVHQIATTVSIGVAAYPQSGTDTDELLLTAKNALFEAQRTGRNMVFSYQSTWSGKEMEKEAET